MTSLRLSLRWVSLTVLLGLLGGVWPGDVAVASVRRSSPRAEAAHWALVVAGDGWQGSEALASVLREQYGFRVLDLMGPDATQKAIDGAMFEIADAIGEYDQLLVHLSLDVVHSPEGALLVPVDGRSEDHWTLLKVRDLLDWLNTLPTSAALVTYPGCDTERLDGLPTYRRSGPVEVLLACGFRTRPRMIQRSRKGVVQRLELESPEAVGWRGDAVAGELAAILAEAVARHEAVTSLELADALSERLEPMRFSLETYPAGEKPRFRFAHIASQNEYETRYAQAAAYGELAQTLQDYLGAAAKDPDLATALAGLLERIATSPNGAAAGAALGERDVLRLQGLAVQLLSRLEASDETRDAMAKIVVGAASSLVRRSAVLALSSQPDLRPVDLEVLRAAVADPDPSVRTAAVSGLALAKDEDSASLLVAAIPDEDDADARSTMILALSDFGRQKDRPLFLDLASHEDWRTREGAVGALTRLGPDPAVNEVLLGLLAGDANSQVRQAAAAALGRTWVEKQKGEIVSHLGEALLDSGSGSAADGLRAAAAGSLGELGGAGAEAALREFLSTGGPERVTVAAIEALGRMRSRAALPELHRAAQADSVSVRRATVTALGKIATPEAVEIIFSKLEDKDPYVRGEAERLLGSLQVGQQTLLDSADSDSALVRKVAVEDLLRRKDSDSLAALIASLGDPDEGVRMRTVEGLAETADADVVVAVLQALDGKDTLIRIGCIRVLGLVRAGDAERILAALGAAASDDDERVRAAAVEALGRRHDPASLRIVLQASEDPSSEVRIAAAEALGRYRTDDAVQRLEVMAKTDPSERVHEVAVEVLSSPLGPGPGDTGPAPGSLSIRSIFGKGDRQYLEVSDGFRRKRFQQFRRGLFTVGDQRPAAFVESHRAALQDLGITPSEINVMLALAENAGNLDFVGTWDSSFLSFGLFAWTLGGESARGELPALLARIKAEDAGLFEKYWGVHGLDVVDIRPTDWQSSETGPVTGRFELSGQPIESAADKGQFRQAPWAFFFWLAGQDPAVQALEVEHALGRLGLFYDTDAYTAGGHRISELITSEYGVSLILDNHVNRPAYVRQCLEQALKRTELSDPSTWATEDERRLIEAYLDIRVTHGSSPMTDAEKRARVTKKYLDLGVVSDSRGSFTPAGAGR
jgi:HEAT repeat protein